jgi:poly(A) polymerase
MLRAARIAANLGFTIAPEAAAPIRDLAPLLADVPAARLFDETLKLFQSGYARKSFDILVEYDLLTYLFPSAASLVCGTEGSTVTDFIREGLANTDARVAEDKSITPMFLYAVFLWPGVRRLADKLAGDKNVREYEAMQEAMFRIVAEQTARTSVPKRFSMPMKEILGLQRRFSNTKGIRAFKLLEHKRFRAAYDFLLLRAKCGEVEQQLADWWTEVQELDESKQREAFEAGGQRQKKRKRRGRGRRRAQSAAPTE